MLCYINSGMEKSSSLRLHLSCIFQAPLDYAECSVLYRQLLSGGDCLGTTRKRRKNRSASIKRACNAFTYFVKDQARRMSEFSPVCPSHVSSVSLRRILSIVYAFCGSGN